jgi:hypothetical protein
MKKVLCLLAMCLIVGTSAGLAQEDKAKADEDEVLVYKELMDPNNERRSIGWEVTSKAPKPVVWSATAKKSGRRPSKRPKRPVVKRPAASGARSDIYQTLGEKIMTLS